MHEPRKSTKGVHTVITSYHLGAVRFKNPKVLNPETKKTITQMVPGQDSMNECTSVLLVSGDADS